MDSKGDDQKEEKKVIFVPGKLILIGEHFVLGGAKGIGLKYPHGVELEYSRSKGKESVVEKVICKHGKSIYTEYVSDICRIIEKYRVSKDKCEKYNLKFQIPYASGLGTSAAIAIAFGLAMDLSREIIFDAINEAENHIHNSASGLDTATILFQGDGVIFHKDMISSIWLPMPLEIIIIDTKKPSNCNTNISKSTNFRRENPTRYLEMVDIISHNVDRLKKEFESLGQIYGTIGQQFHFHPYGDGNTNGYKQTETKVLDEVIKETHELLIELGVYSDDNIKISNILMEHGISCKITGSGDGGCMFAICGWYRTWQAEVRKKQALSLLHKNFPDFESKHIVLGTINNKW